ncbi:glycoside hydrolase family 3 N-terminal domain-containing protein [Pelagicoccus mobilis]|uniref:Glycoside hydrolase family 3 C-terminal domain-containing protein n=1 Tax=Pelagicoccus mobilis TaxID=415221 RepID=A0A934S7Q7_9BACT|nr:glycoside hydrolase family 3 N-terminal domain-containing protein [Pelagicoccus mobilis]MBK1880428.1 glycoside hydrolase family 3 C-terminal domain-containing protein [Pelagicoccus mobilis]
MSKISEQPDTLANSKQNVDTSSSESYSNPKLPLERRVELLLAQMTLEEKAGQLTSTCPVNQMMYDHYTDEEAIENSKKLIDKGIGQIGVAVRHSNAVMSPKVANAIQKYALEESRLGIPVLIQDECVHGCKANGSTMFPQSISMAASWNTELMERVVEVIAKETKARGLNQCFSPTLNLARDVRCGRVEETYGEDPHLLSRMGVAFVKTLQEHGVAASPKHLVANFVGDGGRDSHGIHLSERILREIYFPAYKAAVEEAGAMSIMIAHNALDGIPCGSNKWLMDTVLRKEWGFDGFVVPDNSDVQKTHSMHYQTDGFEASAQICIEAGLDTDMSWPPPDVKLCYIDYLPNLVRSGKMEQEVLDESTARVLRIKFRLGLFENPYVDESIAPEITQSPGHRKMALESALQGTVLLKNEQILPLSGKEKKIAVMGPSAAKTRLGGYTSANPNSVTPVDGLMARAPEGTEIVHLEGCQLVIEDRSEFEAAVKLAAESDLVVLCMGNSSDKVIGQPETTEGERHDRCNLDLPGVQEDFILEIAKVNPNVIVALQNGSAITMSRWLGEVKGVVEQWYAGAECGTALASVLWGDHNPAGRLPITFPTSVGQVPLYYNPRPHCRVSDYMDHRGKLELFEFGYGLSYTTFEYSDLKVSSTGTGKDLSVKAAFTVANTGDRDGDEVVQLYLRDCVSRITRPIKELKAFDRISVNKGESQRVELELGWKDFTYLNEAMSEELEPGEFHLLIGASSMDIRLDQVIWIDEADDLLSVELRDELTFPMDKLYAPSATVTWDVAPKKEEEK